MQHGGLASTGPVYIVRNGSVSVPADYVGMHFRSWPIFDSAYWASAAQPYPSSPAVAPNSLGYGTYRTHDSVFAWWHRIETAPGVYDWSSLDTLISTHRSTGKTVTFCMYGTPDFYLSAGNPFKGTVHANSAYPDGTAPNGVSGLQAFITALVTRYNSAGGAWRTTNPSLGKGIQYLELWNEPEFAQTGSGFWVDSVAKFVDLCYYVRTAAKAVDSTLPVNSPGFSGMNWMQQFLQAAGAVNTGQTGLSVSDAVCFHFYTTTPPGLKFGSWQAANYDISVGDASLRTVMAAAGASGKAIYVTESGIDYTAGTTEMGIINAQTPAWRRQYWSRLMMMGAALGYRQWCTYSWDTPYACNPQADPDGIAAAVTDLHNNVAGRTITDAWYFAGGRVGLRFNDGTTLTV